MSRLLLRLYLATLLSMVGSFSATIWLGWDNLERAVIRQTTRLIQAPMLRISRDLAAGVSPATLSDELGYAVQLISPTQVTLRGAPAERLTSGAVVVQIHDRKIWSLVAVPGELRIARIGPMGLITPESGGRGLIAALSSLVLALFSVGVLGWPLGRQLLQLSAAAERLGAGDLSARAPVLSGDAAGRLAERFNTMAERLEQLIADQEELLRAISHDLRTPMARMRFSLELLSGETEPAQLALRQAQLERDLEAMTSLLDELLLYVRLRSRPPLKPQPLDLRDLLQDLQADLVLLAPALRIELCEGPAASIQGEPQLMRRALENIGVNAIRFAEGRVSLCWTCAGPWVELCIDDDGPGIPAAERERIFEPFGRLEGARNLNEGGSGMGLAIVQQIAQRHGGRAWVTDAPLGGARVCITLPVGASSRRSC